MVRTKAFNKNIDYGIIEISVLRERGGELKSQNGRLSLSIK